MCMCIWCWLLDTKINADLPSLLLLVYLLYLTLGYIYYEYTLNIDTNANHKYFARQKPRS